MSSGIFSTLGHTIQQSGSKHAYFSGQSPFVPSHICLLRVSPFKGSRPAPATVSQSCLMPLLFRTLLTTPLLLFVWFLGSISLGHVSQRYLYTGIHCTVIHNSSATGPGRAHISGEMDKKKVEHFHSGLLFSQLGSLKKLESEVSRGRQQQ